MALAIRRDSASGGARDLLGRFGGPGLEWNQNLQRYRDALTKRIVAAERARLELDRELAAAEGRLRRLGQRFQSGALDIHDWRALAAQEVKLTFLASYAAGRGGWSQMGARDVANVERLLQRQFRYLERFARQVDARPERFGGRAFLSRLGMYAQAAREAHELARRLGHEEAGFLYERNALHSLESCVGYGSTVGCGDLEAAGWQAIGTLPLPGRRACLVRCRCTMHYAKKLPDGYSVRTWRGARG